MLFPIVAYPIRDYKYKNVDKTLQFQHEMFRRYYQRNFVRYHWQVGQEKGLRFFPNTNMLFARNYIVKHINETVVIFSRV